MRAKIYKPASMVSPMEYKELLHRARESLPEVVHEKERFEIPKVRGHLEGNKTLIGNFRAVAEVLGRPPEHLMKYLLHELAAPGQLKPSALVIGTRVSAQRVNEKIRQYAHEFVLCPECGKPDTKIVKEGGLAALRCLACGAKKQVKSRI
jgi:translation initiation factor 2 subunit 2